VLHLCTAQLYCQQVHLLDSYLSTHGLEPIVSTDVGSHQCLLTQYLRLHHPRQWLTEGGLASMGCGMPCAIGAAIANPGKTCLAVCGDGGFAMTSQVCVSVHMQGDVCVSLHDDSSQ
jgi:acetolactate synthase-1/2/3 large subunit